MRRAWPTWLMPNCTSYPSAVRPSGCAMMPALLIKRSSRSEEARKVSEASLTDLRLARLSGRKVMLALGTTALMSQIAASALEGLRAAR